MIYQHIISQWPTDDYKKDFVSCLKPGDFHLFSVSISRTPTWEQWLKDVGLFDKIVYRSEPSYTRLHMERKAPSSFVIICQS